MAVSTTTYFSNSICGVPQLAGELVDLYQTSTTPKFPLGQKFEREDGAIFRYAYMISASSTGALMATVQSDCALSFAAGNTCASPSSSYQMPDEPAGVYPGSLGSRYLVISSTQAAGTYTGGYIVFTKGTGNQQYYRIRASSATNTPASGFVRLSLYDQLVAAIDNTSIYQIAGCKYNVLSPSSIATGNANAIVGVCVTGTTSTTARYGWVQTGGIAPCIVDSIGGGLAAGVPVAASSALAGAISRYISMTTVSPGVNIFDYAPIGYAVGTGSAGAGGLTFVALTSLD